MTAVVPEVTEKVEKPAAVEEKESSGKKDKKKRKSAGGEEANAEVRSLSRSLRSRFAV